MIFFTAGDVLDQASIAAPDEPITIELTDTIHDALSLMFNHNFSQLPVMNDGRVSGTVTYKSMSRMLKSVPDTDIRDKTVKGALVQPEFVDEDHDMFELLDTFAVDEYVLVGTQDDLTGILTRYDVFHFLQDQFKPFIMIGEIERSLRKLFRESLGDLDARIKETFGPRTEEDPSYSAPASIDHFNFEEYKRFIVTNEDELPPQLQADHKFALELLEQVRQNRNALFHFRAEIDEIDGETIQVAHSYFTGLAE